MNTVDIKPAIKKNEAINKNIETLLEDNFRNEIHGAIGRDEDDKVMGWVNMKYNDNGEIGFCQSAESNVRFDVDISYKFYNPVERLASNIFGKNTWKIEDISYLFSNPNEDIKYIIKSAVDYVNKMSKKERAEYAGSKK